MESSLNQWALFSTGREWECRKQEEEAPCYNIVLINGLLFITLIAVYRVFAFIM